MKVVHYIKNTFSEIAEDTETTCFYLPDKEIVLFSRQAGDWDLVDRGEMILEGGAISAGRIPIVKGVRYSNIKQFDYDENKLGQLIRDLKSRNKLDDEIALGIEYLVGNENPNY